MKKHCFGALFRFELLKILKNKVAVATFFIFFAFSLLMGEQEVSGNIDSKEMQKYEVLDGRKIDNALVGETLAAMDEFGKIRSGESAAYGPIADWIVDIVGYGTDGNEITADYLYERRQTEIEEGYEEMGLSGAEIEYWQARENRIDKPLEWKYYMKQWGVIEGMSNVMIIMIMVIGLSLSHAFAMETQRKTDPVIRSCVNGNKELYFAKILAGCAYCMAVVSIYLFSFLLYVKLRWGFDGMDACIQIVMPYAQADLSIGQLALRLAVMLFAATFLLSAAALLVSELTRNGIASMGIMIGGYFGLFALGTAIPLQARILSQIVNWMPGMLVSSKMVYDLRTVRIAGKCLPAWQFAPGAYMIAGVLILAAGYGFYRKYEIKNQ